MIPSPCDHKFTSAKVIIEILMQEWSTWKRNNSFCLSFNFSSIHALSVSVSVSSIPHFGMCDFGIPGIMGHLSRKWQRDGWLRLAVQAHVTVCYGWAVGQSRGSKCSRGRSLTWHALDRHWREMSWFFFLKKSCPNILGFPYYFLISLILLNKRVCYLWRCF